MQALPGQDLLSLAFGRDHADDLPAPADEIAEKPRLGIRQRPDLGPGRLDEVGDDESVDRVALRSLAEGLGEGAHLGWVHHHDGQVRRREARRHHRLVPAGRLNGDRDGRKRLQPGDEGVQTLRVPDDRKHLSGRPHGHVQPILRHVDPDNDGVHPVPSLRNRASLRAAQATVRIRWNGRR